MKLGDRIELLMMDDDPDPIAPGSKGTVTRVHRVEGLGPTFFQVHVDWDNGRSLMLSMPPDIVRVLD